MSQNRDQVIDAVRAFVKAQTWEESKRIGEQRRNLLLTDTADEALSALITQRYRDDEEDVRDLEERRALLARCRREGIDTAFADHLQSLAATPENELKSLLQELSRSGAPG